MASQSFIFFGILVRLPRWIHNRRRDTASFILAQPFLFARNNTELYATKHTEYFPPLISASDEHRPGHFESSLNGGKTRLQPLFVANILQEIVVATSESFAVMTGCTFSNFLLGKCREKLQK